LLGGCNGYYSKRLIKENIKISAKDTIPINHETKIWEVKRSFTVTVISKQATDKPAVLGKVQV